MGSLLTKTKRKRKTKPPIYLLILGVILIVMITFFPVVQIDYVNYHAMEFKTIGTFSMLVNSIDRNFAISYSVTEKIMPISVVVYLLVLIITIAAIYLWCCEEFRLAFFVSCAFIPLVIFYFNNISMKLEAHVLNSYYDATMTIYGYIAVICALNIFVYCAASALLLRKKKS